ncbi:unnamed protein product [Paramecium sonneborni]|uniref:Uncharacterized protein n=1 Tax=Paramecium sonneborni TaxID=65129 RepID=A0A8S1R4T8_9CILI|nr:unnamed protein product [Paramecium sonneborni]
MLYNRLISSFEQICATLLILLFDFVNHFFFQIIYLDGLRNLCISCFHYKIFNYWIHELSASNDKISINVEYLITIIFSLIGIIYNKFENQLFPVICIAEICLLLIFIKESSHLSHLIYDAYKIMSLIFMLNIYLTQLNLKQ